MYHGFKCSGSRVDHFCMQRESRDTEDMDVTGVHVILTSVIISKNFLGEKKKMFVLYVKVYMSEIK